jgi:IclR family transcriptional regulator, KDG regulon repressor
MLYGTDVQNNPDRTAHRLTDRVVKSAERTLAVFEIFSQEQRGLRVGEVSRNLGIPQPSTSMLLKNLARLGYLKHDPQHRTFRPTIRLVLLGSWLNRRYGAAQGLDQCLADLQAEVGDMVYIAMQNASSVQYISIHGHGHTDQLSVRPGQMRPLTACASGHVLLSQKSTGEIRGWIRRANTETSEIHRVNEADFLQSMQNIRKNGYAETAGMTPGSLGEIAISITSPFENSLLAIAVAAPADRLNGRKKIIIPALKRFRASFDENRGGLFAVA